MDGVLGKKSFCKETMSHRLLSFSGDTMPTGDFVEAARDATLIIHEATMGDEEKVSALQKKHSTFSQALDICRRSVITSLQMYLP